MSEEQTTTITRHQARLDPLIKQYVLAFKIPIPRSVPCDQQEATEMLAKALELIGRDVLLYANDLGPDITDFEEQILVLFDKANKEA